DVRRDDPDRGAAQESIVAAHLRRARVAGVHYALLSPRPRLGPVDGALDLRLLRGHDRALRLPHGAPVSPPSARRRLLDLSRRAPRHLRCDDGGPVLLALLRQRERLRPFDRPRDGGLLRGGGPARAAFGRTGAAVAVATQLGVLRAGAH